MVKRWYLHITFRNLIYVETLLFGCCINTIFYMNKDTGKRFYRQQFDYFYGVFLIFPQPAVNLETLPVRWKLMRNTFFEEQLVGALLYKTSSCSTIRWFDCTCVYSPYVITILLLLFLLYEYFAYWSLFPIHWNCKRHRLFVRQFVNFTEIGMDFKQIQYLVDALDVNSTYYQPTKMICGHRNHWITYEETYMIY